uniref:Uncharacterized protein n=1 Tax=Chaetoceros debilis TaxID=122233 RepID=A0A7S3Q0Y2_9STRA|eukprot:CAMPEP_0194078288 /NCGR_PEP_ID=MMETSP0149-20130528/4722_1 /TAXON_ID=122233 /ORGANISM="Chaetoceros debilis, Strain MM31A-1" /LENGTH=816 /DNA_ID=CAMNT_0038759523 /DNA_START=125 /DNA_END=2575 /DNA_ORIENTATION=-
MSLATSGAGAGAGAAMSMAAMAHGGPSAMTTHQQTSNAGGGPPPGGGGTTAAAPNSAALAADLIDKNQNLGWKAVKNLAKMPIVSVDLYGDTGEVAYFPPRNDEEGDYASNMEKIVVEGEVCVKAMGKVSRTGTSLALKKDSDAAHKALRRLITKSKGYETVFNDCLVEDGKADDALLIESPHLLLGERQVKYLSAVAKNKYTVSNESTHVIDEDDSKGITIRNGNLDGSTSAQQNDFDRVTLHLNMHAGKKALSLLPEEAVKIVLAKAKYDVSKSFPDLVDENDKEAYMEFPPAIAVPAWASNHYSIESLMEASDGMAVLYNRSVAALSGALVPKFVIDKKEKKGSIMPPKLWNVVMEKMKAHAGKIEQAQKKKEPLPNASYMPLVIMAGMTKDGLELSAIQIKDPNTSFGRTDCHVPFSEFKVMSTVSYQHSKPVSIVNKTLVELSDIVDEIYPELEDDGGVAGIVTYGTIASQLQLKDALLKALNSIKGDDVWNTKIDFMSTKEEAVSMGTCVLAAVSHNRVEAEIIDEKSKKSAVTVSNIAPCAVGVTYSFDGGKEWTEPKVIFDYDRRVPAGPYKVEFSAAECVAIKEDASLLNDMEKLVEESEKWAKGKHNVVRETAALGLTIKVVQRFDRNGKWREYGYAANPLTQAAEEDDEGGDESSHKFAIETSTLELALDSVGYLSTELSSDGQTIDQAIKAARSSTMWKYVRIAGALVFFGGFMAKSYLGERERERCAQRVLAFYKHATPNTINDGDKNNAHYTCYKYRGKTDKLYRKLERKYDIPVREVHEWEDLEDEEEPEEEKEENLDGEF